MLHAHVTGVLPTARPGWRSVAGRSVCNPYTHTGVLHHPLTWSPHFNLQFSLQNFFFFGHQKYHSAGLGSLVAVEKLAACSKVTALKMTHSADVNFQACLPLNFCAFSVMQLMVVF